MNQTIIREYENEFDTKEVLILPVSALPMVNFCARRFYYHLKFKVQRNRKAVQRSNIRNVPKKIEKTQEKNFQQKLFSSDSLLIRGMCRFQTNTHPPVPVVFRNKLDEQPWELTAAELQLALYALLLSENSSTPPPAYGLILDQQNSRELKVRLKPQLLRKAALVIGKAHATAEMEYAPPGCKGTYCTTCREYMNCYSNILTPISSESTPESSICESDVPYIKTNALPLYVQDQRSKITTNDRVFSITKDNETLSTVLPMDVSSICIFGNVQITTQAITKALRESIPVVFMSSKGNFKGTATPFTTGNALRRKTQFASLDDSNLCRQINTSIVAAKIRNCRNILRRNGSEPSEVGTHELTLYAKKAERCTSTSRLRGYEGTAARIYFSFFEQMFRKKALDEGFTFSQRTRRPPKDPINAMLSFGYALLLKDMIIALELAGLDPMHGFYHISRNSRPALALDIMDSFRPLIVDSSVLSLINNGRISQDDFEERSGGIYFTNNSSKKLIAEYERRLSSKLTDENTGQVIIMRTAIHRTAENLALFLSGKRDSFQLIVGK